jgi:hypothetical protein
MLPFRDGTGHATVLRIDHGATKEPALSNYYAFHFRLENGYKTLLQEGSSYGSFLKPFPDSESSHFFEDFYSDCFVEISLGA